MSERSKELDLRSSVLCTRGFKSHSVQPILLLFKLVTHLKIKN